MIQLILHLWGDYMTQSDWMAQNKTKRWLPAIAHALVYSLPFLLIGSLSAVLVIFATHAIIDRFRLARYLCWAKNRLAPTYTRTWVKNSLKNQGGEVVAIAEGWDYKYWFHSWKKCRLTGYHEDTPVWLATWLMIIADNTMHLTINYSALLWL